MCVYRCSLCLSLVGCYVIGGLDGIYDGAEGYRTDAFLGDIVLLIFGAVDLTNPQLQVSLANCSFVSISLGLVLASRCSLSLPDLLITVPDEVCPLLSDCLPLAGMSCTERLSRVFHSFRR